MTHLIDVFPTDYSTQKTPFSKRNFEEFREKSIPFLCRRRGREVINERQEHDNASKDHFKYAWAHACKRGKDLDRGNWEKARQRHDRGDCQELDRENSKKNNKNVTLAYTYNKNIFLTKKYFTFGIRRTGPDEIHVFQTTDTPIYYYLPRSDVREADKIFPASNQRDYDRYLLECNSSYLVSENTTYLILTPEKSIFVVDKLRSSSLSDVDRSSLFKNPTQKPFTERKFARSKKRKLDDYIGDEPPVQRPVKVEESSARQSTSYVTDERDAECPETSDSRAMDHDGPPVCPSTSRDEIGVVPSTYSNQKTPFSMQILGDMLKKVIPFLYEIYDRQPSDPRTKYPSKCARKGASSSSSQNLKDKNCVKMSNGLQREERNKEGTLAFDYESVSVVEANFTFGIRKTGSEDCCIYHTKDAPMLFVLPKFCMSEDDKTFPFSNPSDYDAYILEPQSSYLVRENTSYIIVSTNKCIFAVDKIRTSDVDPTNNFKNPTKQPYVGHEFVN